MAPDRFAFGGLTLVVAIADELLSFVTHSWTSSRRPFPMRPPQRRFFRLPPLESPAYHRQSLIEARLHCAQRTVELIRYLLKREPVELLEQNRDALLFRQLRHGLGHGLRHFPSRHQVLDRFGGRHPFVSHLYRVDALGQLHHGRTALTPDPIAAQVQCDAVKPGRELGLTAEALESPERPKEGFLDDVTGFFFATQRPEGERVDWPFPA